MKNIAYHFIVIPIVLLIFFTSIAYSQTYKDVTCEFSDNQIDNLSRSVCMVQSSNGQCKGTLLNNENQDRKPCVLLARHCLTTNSF